mgnify:FL=1
MKKILFFLFFTFSFVHSQYSKNIKENYNRSKLIEDLYFIKEKIKNCHINPYTYISEEDLDKQFIEIENKLEEKNSLYSFHKLIRPIFTNLSDDHARIQDIYRNVVIIPLSLKSYQNKLFLKENFSNFELTIGDELITVNNLTIKDLVNNCNNFSFGNREFKNDYTLSNFINIIQKYCIKTDSYTFNFKSGKSVTFNKNENRNFNDYKENYLFGNDIQNENLIYKKIRSNIGYVSFKNFSINDISIKQWKKELSKIFQKIKDDEIKTLYIDMSKNTGGGIMVGNILLNFITDKKMKNFKYQHKDSKEYQEFIKKFKKSLLNPKEKEEFYSIGFENRFKGKVYVIIGDKTYSSGIIFSTLVSDNKIATLIGETLTNAHPNHFGELIAFKTPNTELDFQFSTSSAVRPDETKPNQLIPDLEIDLTNKKIEDIISFVENHSSQKK